MYNPYFILKNISVSRLHTKLFMATAVIISNLILVDVLSAINTDDFQDAFFFIMITSVVVISSAISVFQGYKSVDL